MLGEQLNSVESRGLLLAIDKMREILHGEKVTLPEIVVVGDQSVGKSSVLEAISGIQLPRAQNICTRCPLELRMKTAQDKEYATIRGSGDCTIEKRIDDLTKIADEVTQLTSKIAGEGINVSPHPIYLTVYKRDILYDLTLIDLPGITRNPLPGQAKNIHEQILTLINKYIEPPTAVSMSIILIFLYRIV
jgi:interferon-induced GTP-binding protein Mx1